MGRRSYYKGRKMSKGEKRIAEFLDKHGIRYRMEQSFIGCVGLRGNLLRFDFFLEDYNQCIEFQGLHHYKPVNKHRRAFRVHKETVIHDNTKRKYLSQYTTKLLEIPYWDYDNIESILTSSLLGGANEFYQKVFHERST